MKNGKYILRLAKKDEIKTVSNLYESAKREELCPWNELYPTVEDAKRDFNASGLYVLTDEERIIGALSVVPENEMDSFDCWTQTPCPREIARVVISQGFRGKCLAAFMVSEIIKILSSAGVTAIRLSVRDSNIPALKTYEQCGFRNVGETDMYGGHYCLFEKIFDL